MKYPVRLLLVAATAFFSGSFISNAQTNGAIDGIDELIERRNYMIPMSDGVRLSTDVYLPVLQDALAVDSLPINLFGQELFIHYVKIAEAGVQYMQYPDQDDPFRMPMIFTRTPYNKADPLQGQLIALMGYGGVVQDMRGRYASEGVYYPMYSDSWDKNPYIAHGHPLDITPDAAANAHQDGNESLKYILNDLRWDSNEDGAVTEEDRLVCNGSLGMFGASALGNSQFQAAAVERLEGVKCLLPVVASGEFYHSTGHHNGVFRERIIDGWLRGQIEGYEYLVNGAANVNDGEHTFADFGPGITNDTQIADAAIDFWSVDYQTHYPNSPMRAVMDISRAPINEDGAGDPNGAFSRYRNLDFPVYNLTGWWDIFIDGQIQTWQNLDREVSPENKKYQKLVIGPFAHQTIGSRSTGDMRQIEGGPDYRYPESAQAVIGVNLDSPGPDDVAAIANSEAIHWFREFLGEPEIVLPPLEEWQFMTELAGDSIFVQVPADTLRLSFSEFFNFINGTGGVTLPARIRGIAFFDPDEIVELPVPALGNSLLGGGLAGVELSEDDRTNFDAEADDGVANVRFYVPGPVADGVPENANVGNYWISADTFPLPDLPEQTFYLTPEGGISDQPAEAPGELQYITDPLNPVMTHGGANMIVRRPSGRGGNSQGQMNLADPAEAPFTMDRPLIEYEGSAYPDLLKFESQAFADTFAVAGFPEATIYAKSLPIEEPQTDSTNCDFIVRVLDVYPDGRELFVFEGAVNARARAYAPSWADGVEKDSALFSNILPGETYEYRFRMLPIAYTWGKGHKIKVLISSTNYPRYQSCPNLPLEPGAFFRWRPGENKTYNYKGQALAPRKALQTIVFDAERAPRITFPLLSPPGDVFTERPALARQENVTVKVYPNPARDYVVFQLSGLDLNQQRLKIELYDAVGRRVAEKSFGGSSTQIEAGELSSGIYTAIVKNASGERLAVEKIVKHSY